VSARAPSFASGKSAVLAGLVVLMPLLALIPKHFLIVHSPDARQSIFATGFGFGDYARNLLADGEFRTCTKPSFVACQPDQCQYATRMPVVPILYAALATLVGEQSGSIAFAKCVLTALLLAGLLAVLMRDLRPSIAGVILLYALYFGPQALKHGASIDYEEGVLLDLELALAVAASYLLLPTLLVSQRRTTIMGAVAVGIGVIMYFTKTTALLTLAVVAGLFLYNTRIPRQAKLAVGVLALLPFLAWGAHNYATSGNVHLSSSWNGENLVRGYNSESLAIYPQISLDRILDAPRAVLEDGSSVALGAYASRSCFADEWAWSRFYGSEAIAWLESHPLEAARFTLKKLWVTFVEIRHTPYQVAATQADAGYPPLVRGAMLGWMVLARLVLFALVVSLIIDFRTGPRAESLWTLALVGAAFAPYAAVFAYERHLVPVLIMSGGLLVFRRLFGIRGAVPAAPAVAAGVTVRA
jgi:hypothetical protein